MSLAVASWTGSTAEAQVVYDGAADFSSVNNPNGVWSYGSSPTLYGPFALYTNLSIRTNVLHWADGPDSLPCLQYNGSGADSSCCGTVFFPAGMLGAHPGSGGQLTKLRWTAPAGGNYQVTALFSGLDYAYVTSTDVHVLLNNVSVFDGSVNSYGPYGIPGTPFMAVLTVDAGDTIDFAIGSNGSHVGDSTRFWATIASERPVADAGLDQTVDESQAVTLDGTASQDPEGGALSFAWTQISGATVFLANADTATPTFTAPFVPVGGATLTFQLVVNDGHQPSEPDFVNVTVANVNHPPVALAGDDQMVAEGSPVALDGSNSYDEDNDLLSYSWMQVAGQMVSLDLADPVRPAFIAPLVGPAGTTLVFELTVSDEFTSATDSVAVLVDNVNHVPTANAGLDQTRLEGTSVVLDASASEDPDGDALTFDWVQVGGPAVVLAGEASASPSFTAPQVGPLGALLAFRVTVNDGYGGSASDEVAITVQDANAVPACELARPSVGELWPPNHKLMPISIQGVTDPENDELAITILGVTQDEPIDGLGGGDTAPDAVLQGATVLLRSERNGAGNGRVYRIYFQVDDGHGGTCTGSVTVGVPQSMGKNKPPAIDDGQLYDSLGN